MPVIIIGGEKPETPDPALEQMIQEEFENVKSSFYRPPVSGPEILYEDSNIGMNTAHINFMNLIVSIYPRFLKEVSEGLDINKALRGIFSHEIGHYKFHPADISMQLYLSFMASNIYKEFARNIYALYTDFQDNLLIHNNDFNREDIGEFLKGMNKIGTGSINDAISSAYNDKLNLGLNFDFSKYSDEDKKKVLTAIDELKKVIIRHVDVSSTMDYQIQYSQLIRFGDAIKPLIEMDMQKQKQNQSGSGDSGDPSQNGDPNGSGQGTGPKLLTKEDFENLPSDVRQKLEEEMKKLIKNLPKELYDKLKEHYLGKNKVDKHGMGIGLGTTDTEEAEKGNIEDYMNAAKVYGYYIRPKRILGVSSVKINFGRKDFKPSDNPLGIDMRFSGGKILPGLAKTVRTEIIPFPKTNDFTPRAVIYKDASGSMLNPIHDWCFGTIAGTIIGLSYLRSGSEVGVVLFDSSSDELEFSRDEYSVVKKICSYKGGGTVVNIERLIKDLDNNTGFLPFDRKLDPEELKNNPFFKKYIEMMKNDPRYTQKQARITGMDRLKKESTTDFYIITDGGIANVDELVAFFGDNPGYRPTILHCGGFSINVSGYDQKTNGVYNGISIFKADNDKDMIQIAKDSLKKNLLS